MIIFLTNGRIRVQKQTGPNLILPKYSSRSTLGHHFNKLGTCTARVRDAANQVSRS